VPQTSEPEEEDADELLELDVEATPPHASVLGTQSCTTCPWAVVSMVQAASAPHACPPVHSGAQYVSPSS
jgi:hypothetical protein